PFFALRFSACQNYSQTFADVISAAVAKPHYPPANCMADGCGYCSGEAVTRVYTHDGKHLCGARQLEIPNIAPGDMAEIKRLIHEQHEYLLKHEAGVII
ncbi:MAG: hypothetical protein FWD06_10950, partial [Oscillospiraceae bacterium]|nr:hypothetical protein [Oscillospiraceae bacterium]